MSGSSVQCLGLCGNPRKEDLQPALELILGICDELGVAYRFQAKLAAQVDRQERLAAADDVVDNAGSLEQSRTRVAELHAQYLELA